MNHSDENDWLGKSSHLANNAFIKLSLIYLNDNVNEITKIPYWFGYPLTGRIGSRKRRKLTSPPRWFNYSGQMLLKHMQQVVTRSRQSCRTEENTGTTSLMSYLNTSSPHKQATCSSQAHKPSECEGGWEWVTLLSGREKKKQTKQNSNNSNPWQRDRALSLNKGKCITLIDQDSF